MLPFFANGQPASQRDAAAAAAETSWPERRHLTRASANEINLHTLFLSRRLSPQERRVLVARMGPGEQTDALSGPFPRPLFVAAQLWARPKLARAQFICQTVRAADGWTREPAPLSPVHSGGALIKFGARRRIETIVSANNSIRAESSIGQHVIFRALVGACTQLSGPPPKGYLRARASPTRTVCALTCTAPPRRLAGADQRLGAVRTTVSSASWRVI